jgi:hypothetical protein
MTEAGLIVLCSYLLIFAIGFIAIDRLERQLSKAQREHREDKENWIAERQTLLDRIQAPSFAEYTNKVIREKKIEKQEEEKPIEFIS